MPDPGAPGGHGRSDPMDDLAAFARRVQELKRLRAAGRSPAPFALRVQLRLAGFRPRGVRR